MSNLQMLFSPLVRLFKLKLHWQILIAISLAIFVGYFTTKQTTFFGIDFYASFKGGGNLFMQALKMIIIPLVVASIITGIAGIGGSKGLGRMLGKTILYYMATSLFAITIGLAIVNTIVPGVVNGQPIGDLLNLHPDSSEKNSNETAAADTKTEMNSSAAGSTENNTEVGSGGGVFSAIFGLLSRMIPPNIFKAAVEGQMLALIFFSVLFGFFITKIPEAYAEAQYNFWQGVYEVMIKITDLVLKFAPLGIFCLIAAVVVELNIGEDTEKAFKVLDALKNFVITVLLALGIHMFVTMPALLKFIGRVNPLRHFKAMTPALLTSFSTASSSATLPVTLECVEKNAKVSNRTSSFVLPLGATINMDGTALYECVVAVFVFQAFGYDLTFTQQFLIVFTALLTSIGVAGVPAASLVAIVIILETVGLDKATINAGLALVLVVDRVLDMCRTSVNVFSDSCGAVIIGRSEGEEQILADEDDPKTARA